MTITILILAALHPVKITAIDNPFPGVEPTETDVGTVQPGGYQQVFAWDTREIRVTEMPLPVEAPTPTELAMAVPLDDDPLIDPAALNAEDVLVLSEADQLPTPPAPVSERGAYEGDLYYPNGGTIASHEWRAGRWNAIDPTATYDGLSGTTLGDAAPSLTPPFTAPPLPVPPVGSPPWGFRNPYDFANAVPPASDDRAPLGLAYGNAELDGGAPNHDDPAKRGFDPS